MAPGVGMEAGATRGFAVGSISVGRANVASLGARSSSECVCVCVFAGVAWWLVPSSVTVMTVEKSLLP